MTGARSKVTFYLLSTLMPFIKIILINSRDLKIVLNSFKFSHERMKYFALSNSPESFTSEIKEAIAAYFTFSGEGWSSWKIA